MYFMLFTLLSIVLLTGIIIAYGGLYVKVLNSVAMCIYGYATYTLLNTRVRVKMYKVMGRVFHNTKRRYDTYKRNYLLMPKLAIYTTIRKYLLRTHDDVKDQLD
jgi:hypothetical protein